ELEKFLALAATIPQSRKLTAVHEILDRFPGKFLIFTEYRQTQESILEALAARGIVTVSFHGGLDIRQKELAVQRFREEPDVRVLVSTESGAEGRNLQFCHQLINYDLPWNPMRVEQRIGRLHRLGQAHDVTIFNLSCNETIEAHVLDLLARKIRMFELVIGELDMILGNVDGAKSFEDLLREAWEAAGSEEDLRQRIDRLGDVLVHARRDYDRVREANELLDWALDGQ
ncbi:MAG: SWF/SNF helicase family protein, partial [Caldilineaceae bacterium]|nr:SWF/SNF helicase family protein [Caldilineaceae bacterium]